MVRENDYTGVPIEGSDELSALDELGLYEFDAEEDVDATVTTVGEDDEMLIHVGGAANGARTLRAAAEMLYNFADELLELSSDGWEIVDDITQGHGTAVRFDIDDPDEVGSFGG